MKSIKKHFKTKLSDIERAASDLMLLSVDISMLEAVQLLANKVLTACEVLRVRASELDKKHFVEQILQEEALSRLDELVDEDVISLVEQRFSAVSVNSEEGAAAELLRQLLDKLERRYVALADHIQQLGRLLNVG